MDTTRDVAQLVRMARDGDIQALETLYAILRERVLPRIRQDLPRQLDPEDVIEDAMVAVWLGLGRLRKPASFFAYAEQTARHLARERARDLHRYLPLRADTEETRPDLSMRNPEAEEGLFAVLQRLSEVDRKLFRLLYVTGANSAEVELTLHVTHSHFKVMKHRLRRKVLRLMGHHWPEP